MRRWAAGPVGPHVAWIEGDDGLVLDGGPGLDRPRDVPVELYWPVEDRPAIGAPVEVVRGDTVIARGTIDDIAREGRLAATIHVPAGVRLKRRDRVRPAP